LSLESYIGELTISRQASPLRRMVGRGGAPTPPRTVRGIKPKGAPETGAKTAALSARLEAAVDAGSVLSFVDDVDAREQSDILYSVQLAQRAADAACNRFAETRTWYGKYNEVLEAVGWMTEQYAFSAHDQAEGTFRMDKAALGVITAIATGNQLQAIAASISALEKLAEEDGAITLFDHFATADLSGNFQIGAVQKGSTGSLSMALGAFYFRSTARRKKFLFFQWGGGDVNFWAAAQKMTFNTAIYDKIRSVVEKKLGEKASDYIAGINIG
jgi:hypothetical protein